MSTQGLPDFARPIVAEAAHIFYPYEGVGPFLLTPDRLEVASRPDNTPDFALDIIRGRTPLLPPQPYGVLDFRLQAHYRTEESLGIVREHQSAATIAPTAFRSGFLHLQAGTPTEEIPAELLHPIALAWNGLGNTRSTMRLSLDGAVLLRRALQNATLLLVAVCELELIGVSPRLPLTVSFDPPVFLQALQALANQQGAVGLEALEAFFRQDQAELPLTFHGAAPADDQGRQDFAETMVDHVRQRFGSFVPSPAADMAPYIALNDADLGSGRFVWDLGVPLVAARTVTLQLQPLAAAQQLVQERGLDAVVHERVVPPVPRGTLSVAVSANLPKAREGVYSLGVDLYAAPRMPQRPQARVATVEFEAPQDATTATLALSPGEPAEYTYTTFAVVRDAGGIERLQGEEIAHTGDVLNLTTEDFPLEFVAIAGAPALLELAVLEGTLRRMDGEQKVEQPFKLSLEQPELVLALPLGTKGAMIEITARERAGTGELRLEPMPAQDLWLDTWSFREYGPQQIEIECLFAADSATFAIELLPESAEETGASSVLSFHSGQTVRRWTYFAGSPFRGGYRFRPYRSHSQLLLPWSKVRPPFERLVLQVSADQEVLYD